MKVKNKRCIRNLSFKQFKAAKTRNLISVCAIALTTLLFTSLFTIALSINDGFQQSNFRQCGGWNHGTFKYLTEEQFEEIKEDPLLWLFTYHFTIMPILLLLPVFVLLGVLVPLIIYRLAAKATIVERLRETE